MFRVYVRMFRVYVMDRGCAYWLRRWLVADGQRVPVLSTKRDHALAYRRFDEAKADLDRLKAMRNEAHIETRNM